MLSGTRDTRYFTNNENLEICYPSNPSVKFKFDKLLWYRLLSLAKDSGNDFSFIILISGDGMVRVGKSMLAQQVAYILGEETGIGFDLNCDTVIFAAEDLITKATYYGLKGERKIFWYDEARADMNAKQAMSSLSKTLGDFIAETGKFNHILILVLPDFFELEKRYALNYSEFLINCMLEKKKVVYKDNPEVQVITRQRGKFTFFSRKKKKYLYIMGKDFLNYHAVYPTFKGKFWNYWIINRAIYEQKKDDFLRRDRAKKEAPKKPDLFNEYIFKTCQDMGMTAGARLIAKSGMLSEKAVIGRYKATKNKLKSKTKYEELIDIAPVSGEVVSN